MQRGRGSPLSRYRAGSDTWRARDRLAHKRVLVRVPTRGLATRSQVRGRPCIRRPPPVEVWFVAARVISHPVLLRAMRRRRPTQRGSPQRCALARPRSRPSQPAP
ncbi:hypothetical protein ACFPRL_22800 [Pseudoclavibacter helvolus]